MAASLPQFGRKVVMSRKIDDHTYHSGLDRIKVAQV